MPRISPSIMSKARMIDKRLPLLLPECRSIPAAEQELKWLKNELNSSKRIFQACKLRAIHYPLQYILGSQPFGELDIICRPGVLIPRWETAEWAQDLADRLPTNHTFTVVDLCTGSGCIPLLLKHCRPNAEVIGIDISAKAQKLTCENAHNLSMPLQFIKEDVINNSGQLKLPKVDILTCNPPYIPRRDFVKEASLSVKLYEPKLALLGNREFYLNLVKTWLNRTDSFVYEVGDISQCELVLKEIQNNPNLSPYWHVGFKYDSNRQPRVVYGFKKNGTSLNMLAIFQNYGKLMH